MLAFGDRAKAGEVVPEGSEAPESFHSKNRTVFSYEFFEKFHRFEGSISRTVSVNVRGSRQRWLQVAASISAFLLLSGGVSCERNASDDAVVPSSLEIYLDEGG